MNAILRTLVLIVALANCCSRVQSEDRKGGGPKPLQVDTTQLAPWQREVADEALPEGARERLLRATPVIKITDAFMK